MKAGDRYAQATRDRQEHRSRVRVVTPSVRAQISRLLVKAIRRAQPRCGPARWGWGLAYCRVLPVCTEYLLVVDYSTGSMPAPLTDNRRGPHGGRGSEQTRQRHTVQGRRVAQPPPGTERHALLALRLRGTRPRWSAAGQRHSAPACGRHVDSDKVYSKPTQ